MKRSTVDCRLCGVQIQEATSRRTKGICRPCSYRPKIRLKPEGEKKFARMVQSLMEAGWVDSYPEKRLWLDHQMLLRRRIQRSSEELYLALAVEEIASVDVSDAERAALKLASLRVATRSSFLPVNIRETFNGDIDQVEFDLTENHFVFRFDQPRKDRRQSVLDFLNESLRQVGHSSRFFVLPSSKGPWRIVFVPPEVYDTAVTLGVVPGCTTKATS